MKFGKSDDQLDSGLWMISGKQDMVLYTFCNGLIGLYVVEC